MVLRLILGLAIIVLSLLGKMYIIMYGAGLGLWAVLAGNMALLCVSLCAVWFIGRGVGREYKPGEKYEGW